MRRTARPSRRRLLLEMAWTLPSTTGRLVLIPLLALGYREERAQEQREAEDYPVGSSCPATAWGSSMDRSGEQTHLSLHLKVLCHGLLIGKVAELVTEIEKILVIQILHESN